MVMYLSSKRKNYPNFSLMFFALAFPQWQVLAVALSLWKNIHWAKYRPIRSTFSLLFFHTLHKYVIYVYSSHLIFFIVYISMYRLGRTMRAAFYRRVGAKGSAFVPVRVDTGANSRRHRNRPPSPWLLRAAMGETPVETTGSCQRLLQHGLLHPCSCWGRLAQPRSAGLLDGAEIWLRLRLPPRLLVGAYTKEHLRHVRSRHGLHGWRLDKGACQICLDAAKQQQEENGEDEAFLEHLLHKKEASRPKEMKASRVHPKTEIDIIASFALALTFVAGTVKLV